MRQFYLYKNQSGYYNAVLVDPFTGKKGKDKSTHTKDKIQAAVIASGWVEHEFLKQDLTPEIIRLIILLQD